MAPLDLDQSALLHSFFYRYKKTIEIYIFVAISYLRLELRNSTAEIHTIFHIQGVFEWLEFTSLFLQNKVVFSGFENFRLLVVTLFHLKKSKNAAECWVGLNLLDWQYRRHVYSRVSRTHKFKTSKTNILRVFGIFIKFLISNI